MCKNTSLNIGNDITLFGGHWWRGGLEGGGVEAAEE